MIYFHIRSIVNLKHEMNKDMRLINNKEKEERLTMIETNKIICIVQYATKKNQCVSPLTMRNID